MANQYFAHCRLPKLGESFKIENEKTAHHIFTVMRAGKGDTLRLVFDGQKVGLAEVVSADSYEFRLTEMVTDETELPINVTIAVGFPKSDKLDFITEKATELGASAIWAAPFAASVVKWNTEKRNKRTDKLLKIALSAAEQARRLVIPNIHLYSKLTDLTVRFTDFDTVLIAYEESAKSGESTRLTQSLQKLTAGQKLLVVFGPEGGISPDEIHQFIAKGAICVGLGPRILRAETAPLYVLSAISSYLELQKNLDDASDEMISSSLIK